MRVRSWWFDKSNDVVCGRIGGRQVNQMTFRHGELLILVLFYRYGGRLSALLPISINVGVLIGFLADAFLAFDQIPYVTIACLTLFLCTFLVFPDSPRQLYRINKKEVSFEMNLYFVIYFHFANRKRLNHCSCTEIFGSSPAKRMTVILLKSGKFERH